MDQPTSSPNVNPHADQPSSDIPSRSGSVPSASQPTWNDSFGQLDTYAERLRTMLPAAPPGLLDGYMRFAPWIAIIFGALGVLFSLLGLLFGAALSPLLLVFGGAAGLGFSGALIFALVVGLLINVLEVVGGYLMLQRRATGWWLLAFGMVVSVLQNLLGRSVLVLIVVVLIAYIHLQVKPNYRD